MDEQELRDDLRIIESAFDRTAYQASIDRATRTLSVDVLARMQQRRRFPAWKVLAAALPVAAAVVVLIAPWTSTPPSVQTTPSPSVASATVPDAPAISSIPSVSTTPGASVRKAARNTPRASAAVTDEQLLSEMYGEQFVNGLSASIQEDQPTMFELTSQDLRLLSMSVNNEDAF
ncbi:MAG: hypothetical protein JSS89_02000 [Bacteroidetes bacterium]|nr:hypothetical protein [Bacteroidota bacterium]